MNLSLPKPDPKRTAPTGGGPAGGGRRGNVLADDDSDDSDAGDGDGGGGGGGGRRAAVNRALAAEQAALRARAERAAASSAADLYDYDGGREEEEEQQQQQQQPRPPDAVPAAADAPERGSRYMRDLLAASQARRLQRELVQERRVAREQEQEASGGGTGGADLRDRPAFVTASYKRKLQEREVWLAEERERERRDGAVESRGMAGFYGNLNQNVALGHAGAVAEEGNHSAPRDESREAALADNSKSEGDTEGLGFLEGFEMAGDEPEPDTMERGQEPERTAAVASSPTEPNAAERNRIKRRLIEQKIAAARLRYFQRHHMEPEQ